MKSWKHQQKVTAVEKHSNKCSYSCWGFAEDILQVALFTILYFRRSVKEYCVSKTLFAIWESFLYENNSNFSCNRFSYKLVFIIFLFFCMKQKQKSIFQKVGGLVIKNIFYFCLQRLTLYLKGMSNSLDSYKWIFWNFIPVCL